MLHHKGLIFFFTGEKNDVEIIARVSSISNVGLYTAHVSSINSFLKVRGASVMFEHYYYFIAIHQSLQVYTTTVYRNCQWTTFGTYDIV
jgi:hypothetical protein